MRLVLCAAVVVLAAGCGSAPFSERDPDGYEACSVLAETSAHSSAGVQMGGLIEAARYARKASTKAIRDSATSLFDSDAVEATGGTDDFPIVDADELRAACSDEGFEF